MNLPKTVFQFKVCNNTIKDIIFFTQHSPKREKKKLVPNLSSRNYFHKTRKRPLFIKTITPFDLDKLKLKKSSSSIFRNNDVDLVRNLNFDYMSQLNDNIILRENLINSLGNNYHKEEEGKIGDLIDEKLNKNENEKDQIQFPKLSIIKSQNKYKPYETVQSHRKKVEKEMSEHLQKELINRLKKLREEAKKKKTEKNEIFKKIKKIKKELDEIDLEKIFSKEKYKKQIGEILRKTIEERKEEIIKQKLEDKLEAKKKKLIKPGNFLELFNPKKNDNINHNKIINSQNNSPKENIKNDEEKQASEKSLSRNIASTLDNNSNSTNNRIERKSLNKKSLEIFKINLLQTQRKKEFQDFQNAQKEKVLNLKGNLKNLENELNKIDKDLEMSRKEEKDIVSKLMLFYKEILFKGKVVKNDGLVWIIKAIWYLGENVPMQFMPQYLDFESIDYLFQLAHKQLEIEYFSKKVREMKLALKKDIWVRYKDDIKKLNISNEIENENNNDHLDTKKLLFNMKKQTNELLIENKKDTYRNLVKKFKEKNLQFELTNLPEINQINIVKKQIEKIKDEIMQLKQNEVKRITKCFIEKNYGKKYNTTIETVLTALIGSDAKDTELNKYNIHKKNYIANLKKIRFFDHEHIKKILPK